MNSWVKYNAAPPTRSQGISIRTAGQAFARISPTYIPDLVDACLDVLVDGEAGVWHLTNGAAQLGRAGTARLRCHRRRYGRPARDAADDAGRRARALRAGARERARWRRRRLADEVG
jgi:dTDP-4-dehydrorhamnose reductase